MVASNGDILTWNTALAAPLQYEWQPPQASLVAPTIFHPVGFTAIDEDLATLAGTPFVTTEVDEEARAVYLGRAQRVFTGCKVVVDVQTAAAGTDWAEAAILKGTPVLCNGPSALTRIKAVDASADWAAPGPVATDFGAVTIAAGDHMWFAWACKKGGGTLPSFRAFLADKILSGLFVYVAATRLTTMAASTNFNRCGNTILGVHSLAGCTY